MNVSIGYHPQFRKEVKRLAKKYRSLISDFERLLDDIKANPALGIDLGCGVRKIRMAITSKGKGKSGGARVITYRMVSDLDGNVQITLLTMYDKNEIANISNSYISSLLKEICQ